MIKEFLLTIPLLISRSVVYDSYTFVSNNYNRGSREIHNLYLNDLDNSITHFGNYDNFTYVDLNIAVDTELFNAYTILGDIYLDSQGVNGANIYPKYFISDNNFSINYALGTTINNSYLTFGYDLPSDFVKGNFFDTGNTYSNTSSTNIIFELVNNINFYIVNVDNDTFKNGDFYLYYTFNDFERYIHYSTLIELRVLQNATKQTLYFSGDELDPNSYLTAAVDNDTIDSCNISLLLIYTTGAIDSAIIDQITNDAYNSGYNAGYSVGFSAGNTSNFSFLGVLGAIADTPVLMLRNLFDFSLFGVQMYTVIFGLVTALMVLWVIKKVI